MVIVFPSSMKGPVRNAHSVINSPVKSYRAKPRSTRNMAMIGSMIAVFLMIISSFSVLTTDISSVHNGIQSPMPGAVLPSFSNGSTPVAHQPSAVSAKPGNAYTGKVQVLITFKLNNQSRLNNLLGNLYNQNSTQYHKFLTRKQFAKDFSVSGSTYNETASYFSQYSALSIRKYADRVSMSVSGPASELGTALNTTFLASSTGSGMYYASSAPELPTPIGQYASYITGLSNRPANFSLNIGSKLAPTMASPNKTAQGYPAPQGNLENLNYGSDAQVAYGEQTLLNVTYPTGEVIATLLWSGQNASGNNVGPFYPRDIYQYYNSTLPSYEPHAHVHGVPVNGAPKPGISSTYDVTGASGENTLDLEMAGSSAPGSNIYNVYGPNGTYYSIDSALAFILNPNSTYSALNNVSVITNSWGGGDYNNTAWYNYMQEASARGITVLASSGDSGDNNNSSKNLGGPDNLWYPASLAYNNFGITAVGGTTLTLNNNLHIKNQTAWYISANDTLDGGPAGSTGGISTVFREPSWQKNTEANKAIQGQGRGVPDISAMANNTIVYETYNGTSHYGIKHNPYVYWGTSIASPLMAGMIAEMDAVLHHYNQSSLGYLNPEIYKLGNGQVQPFTQSSTHGYYPQGTYNSTLPMLPFNDVTTGRNHLYNATFGYDLVTGWGSINAYNFTNYILNRNFSYNHYALKGVGDNFTLKGLKVTSYIYSGGNNVTNTAFNASIQQNFVVANELGAPVYWVQNVIYINGSQSTGWAVNYTGWVIFPFYGQYPRQPVYEYNYPMGKIVHMPHTFNVTSWISNLTEKGKQTMNFEVNSHVVTLPVPGAAFIIGEHNYRYAYNGSSYRNGPYPSMTLPGGLDPQFGLVGGPSYGVGFFGSPTLGYLNASVEPVGLNSYTRAKTSVYNYSNDQTGEQSRNLHWTRTGTSSWSTVSGSLSYEQGVLSYLPRVYNYTFTETGLPHGASWSITTPQKTYSSSRDNATLWLSNGTYELTVTGPAGYTAYPVTMEFNVSGYGGTFEIAFQPVSDSKAIRSNGTLDLFNGRSYPGYSINTIPVNGSQGYNSGLKTAYNQKGNLLYSTNTADHKLEVYNMTTGSQVNSVKFSSNNDPFAAIYDNATGYVYVESGIGNLTAFNGSTLAREWAVKFPVYSYIDLSEMLLASSGSDIVFASPAGNLTTIDAHSGHMLKNTRISSAEFALFAGELNMGYSAIVGNNVYMLNRTSDMVIVVNLSTYKVTSRLSLPSEYGALALIHYGNSPELLVTSTNYTNQVLNTRTNSFSTIDGISGLTLDGAYDPLTGNEYVYTFNGTRGNITAIDVTSGSDVATAPGPQLTFSVMYDSQSQQLLTSNTLTGEVTQYALTHYYTVRFTEQGLPTGTTWYLNITGGSHSGPLSGSGYTVQLKNGTYSFTTSTSATKEKGNTGSVAVKGAPVKKSVVFSTVNYTMAFHENGLKSGTKWYISINGGTRIYSTGTTINLNETNGTYSYAVYNLTSYYTPDHSGTVSVNGNNTEQVVDFTHYAYISGTVIPGNANVKVNGKSVAVSNGKFNISEIKGEYNVTVSLSGYHSYNRTFNLTPDQVMKVSVNLSRINNPANPSTSPLLYAAAGGIGIAAVGSGVGLWFRRRRK